MFKILSIVAAALAAFRAARIVNQRGDDLNVWRRDPLAHPALRGMSQAELGDLPIGHPRLRQVDC